MSAPTSEAAALPVTGSGPFTFAIGLIGLCAIAAGALMRRLARRPATDAERHAVPSVPGRPDISSDLAAAFGTPAR
jgi:hypothetical protein